jgi:hypothetical protein
MSDFSIYTKLFFVYTGNNIRKKGLIHMNIKKRAAALFLGSLLLISSLPGALADTAFMGGGHTYYRSHVYTAAYRTQYASNSLRHRTAGLSEENIISFVPNEGLRPVIVSPDRIYQNGMTITEAAQSLRNQGHDVVGGINGSFFNPTMIPIGLQLRNGVLTCYRLNSGYLPVVGFTASGGVMIGDPDYSISISSADGTVVADRLNYQRSPDLVHMYTRDFAATTRTTLSGTHVVMRISGRLRPGAELTGTVTRVLTGTEAHSIADDELVLSASSQNAIDRFAFLTEGSEVTVNVNIGNPDWADVINAVTGLNYLVRNGQSVAAPGGTRAPRTTVGIRADGSVVMYTVDGRQSGHSIGLTLEENAARMIDLGCVTAVEMDSGGSTAMAARMPGERNAALVNRPSDGRQRRCADYIMLINTFPQTDGTPAHLFPDPAYVTMMPSATAVFSMRSTDIHYRASGERLGQISSASGNSGVGRADGLIFSSLSPGETSVTFNSGGASGTAHVNVTERLDSLAVTDAKTGLPAADFTASPGQITQFSASGRLNNAAVLSTPRSFGWAVEGDIGTVTADGVFAASMTAGASGRIIITGGGQTVRLNVTIGEMPDSGRAPSVLIGRPYRDGNELVYIVAAADRRGRLPGEVVIKRNGIALRGHEWDGIQTSVRVPVPASGFHILSAEAEDSSGRRARQISYTDYGRQASAFDIQDTVGEWHEGYISFLDIRGILDIEYVSDLRYYRPEQHATRLEVARMLYRILALPEGTSALPFDDVTSLGAFDRTVVGAVYQAGIFGGKTRPDGSVYFDPEGLITRAELFTVIVRALPDGYEQADLTRFSDAGDIPSYAREAARTLVGIGAVTGSAGRINPHGLSRRSEVCALLTRMFY